MRFHCLHICQQLYLLCRLLSPRKSEISFSRLFNFFCKSALIERKFAMGVRLNSNNLKNKRIITSFSVQYITINTLLSTLNHVCPYCHCCNLFLLPFLNERLQPGREHKEGYGVIVIKVCNDQKWNIYISTRATNSCVLHRPTLHPTRHNQLLHNALTLKTCRVQAIFAKTSFEEEE